MTEPLEAKRPSGRAPGEMRPLRIKPGAMRHAEGSCLIELGRTAVLCSASLEDKPPSFLRGKGRGWITAEYAMLPRSTHERTARDIWRGKAGGRTHEIQRLIGRSLRAVANLDALGERMILIDCDVIEADGGTRVASITGAFVALALALEGLRAAKALKGRVLRDYAAGMSVGIVGGVPVLDLEYVEDAGAGVDMNVVMTGNGELVEVQGTADTQPFSTVELGTMLDLARSGIKRSIAAQRRAIKLERLP